MPDIKNIFEIKNINKKYLTNNVELYDFGSERILKAISQNQNYETVHLTLNFIDDTKSYTIKSILTDEIYFKTGKQINDHGFLELILPPKSTSVYLINEYSNVNGCFEAINLILRGKPLSASSVKNMSFLNILKAILLHSSSQYSFDSVKFFTKFLNLDGFDYFFVMNESFKNANEALKGFYFGSLEADYILLEDILNKKIYIRNIENLQKEGLKIFLEQNSAHFFKITKIKDDESKIWGMIYQQSAFKGIESDKLKNIEEIPKDFMQVLESKSIVYLCMEMFIAELDTDAAEANFSGGLGILAGCSMEGFSNIGLNVTGVIPMYKKRRVQIIDENLHQVIKEKIVNYSKSSNLEKVIDKKTGEQLIIFVNVKNKKYAVKIWKINRAGSTVYMLEEPDVFDILYTGSREHRLLQEVVIGKVMPILLKTLNIRPSVVHLNESHTVLAAVNIKEWKDMVSGDDFFDDTRILFTIHTPRAAGMEVFYTPFEDLEIPYSYKKIFDPKNKGKLDFTNAALELCDRVNTVSNNQVKVVKRRIFSSRRFDRKVIGIMNGSSKNYWMADNLKNFENISDIDAQKIIQISSDNKKNVNFLDSKKPSLWAVRRIVDYKNQWPFLKDIIRTVCGDLGFQVVIGGMAHPDDKVSQTWIHEFCSWAKGKWRDDLNKDFSDAPELARNFFFIESGEEGFANLLKMSAIAGDVCLEIPKWDEEACGTSGMRALGNANISINSSDGALEWLKDGKNSFLLKPYTKQRLLELLRIVSGLYYSDSDRLVEMKKNAFITWNNALNIDIMSRQYAQNMFYPAIRARKILR